MDGLKVQNIYKTAVQTRKSWYIFAQFVVGNGSVGTIVGGTSISEFSWETSEISALLVSPHRLVKT